MEEDKKELDLIPKTKEEVEKLIKQITESGLQVANVELLYKLIDIHKDIENEEYWKKKEENMMYRDYDNYSGGRSRDSRGRYMDSYGKRGVPGTGRGRYRGYDMIEEMGEHYGDYSEGRDNYGNDRETEKSFDKMLQSLEDFTYLIMQEADSPDKIEKVRKTARKISEF
ncbi:MAG: hypothetical protein SPI94_04055 [Candidatus Onthovivens sp.]|nr:hypothetical protein [Candidatus Onthovivens sp.]